MAQTEKRAERKKVRITVAAPFSSSGTVATDTVDAVPPAAETAAEAAAAALAFPPLLFWTRSVLSAAEEEAGMTCKRAAAEGAADRRSVQLGHTKQSKQESTHSRVL